MPFLSGNEILKFEEQLRLVLLDPLVENSFIVIKHELFEFFAQLGCGSKG
jgi:hypothetical protein